jgi:hypothetical protein
MGHRMNEWIQWLLVPGFAISTILLMHLGFSVWRTLTIVLPLFVILMFVMVVVDPGPRAKGFVEGLKNRLR